MEEPKPPQDLLDLQAELRGMRDASSAELLTRILPRLRTMARQNLPPKSQLRLGFDSEDLLQEGLLQLVRQVDTFRGTTWAEFLAFAHSILTQKTAQQARRHTVRRNEFQSTFDSSALPSDDPTPSVNASTAEDKKRVKLLVGTLPEPYREAIELRLQGFENQAIAERLGISEEAVRQRLSRAVKMLQERW